MQLGQPSLSPCFRRFAEGKAYADQCIYHPATGRLFSTDGLAMDLAIAFLDKVSGASCWSKPWSCVNGNCDSHYAISDVYFVEVCVINHVCRNKAELFALQVGELFECDLDEAAVLEMEGLLKG